MSVFYVFIFSCSTRFTRIFIYFNKRFVFVVLKCWYFVWIYFMCFDMGIFSCVIVFLCMFDYIVLGIWIFLIIEFSFSTNTGFVGSNRRVLYAMWELKSFWFGCLCVLGFFFRIELWWFVIIFKLIICVFVVLRVFNNLFFV